jgi:hypothetical protein
VSRYDLVDEIEVTGYLYRLYRLIQVVWYRLLVHVVIGCWYFVVIDCWYSCDRVGTG